jgi:putative acetyltransferase
MQIRIDDLTGPEIKELLAEHLRWAYRVSPPESVHALDLEKLRRPEITFWTIWDGPNLAGCAALKRLTVEHGEVKSMRTADACQRKGVAAHLLGHLIDEARRKGLRRLSLETGSQPYFEPARRLYNRFGFHHCPPFEGYVEDPSSVFMTREL